jgi:DNA-binding FadR family transcriptional regulator
MVPASSHDQHRTEALRMVTSGDERLRVRSMRRPRLAEMVAGQLRDQIVSGELADGRELPTVERLMQLFDVSAPSVREALRILENERLITVRRGSVGGAIVHRPRAEAAAYMLGLVLQSRQVRAVDIAHALAQLEPLCARLCAERPDRDATVLPLLSDVHVRMAAVIDDGAAFVQLASEFHHELVALCGNASLALVGGSLEWLWSSQTDAWARRAAVNHEAPVVEQRRAGLEEHAQIIAAIREGDGPRAEALVRSHVSHRDTYGVPDDGSPVVSATRLRGASASVEPGTDDER